MTQHDGDVAPEELAFAATLRRLMKRPTHDVTPGWLSKVSGIPKATIVNWLEGRVRRPRRAATLHAVCDGLRLTAQETGEIYASAGLVRPAFLDGEPPCERVPVGLYRTTLDGRVLYANVTLVEMLGYPDLLAYLRVDVGRDLYVHASQRRTWLDRISVAGTVRRYPVWAKRADGSRLLVLDSAAAVRDARGAIVHFEGVWEEANPD